MINIDAIKARLVRATPGPWRLKPQDPAKIHRGTVVQIEEDGRATEVVAECYCGAYEGHGLHNADLIAHAPTDLDALVEEVERLRGEAERERAAVVAWLREKLRENEGYVRPVAWEILSAAADCIERAAHRREETK